MKETSGEKSLDNQLFKHMISNNWNAVVFANMNNIIEYVNPAACKLYGYEEHELIGKTTDVFNSKLTHNTDDIVNSIKEKGYWFGELIQRKKDNSIFDALLSVQLIFNEDHVPVGFASNSKDITLEIESSENLKRIIEEKEILLRELHHRVKNNLALIKSILSLQTEYYKNSACSELVENFKNRVDAIATLHNTLYTVDDLKEVNLKPFIEDLCKSLTESFKDTHFNVKINLSIDNHIKSLAEAVPLGLIINEVITNSFKHAFIGDNNGLIRIKLINEGKNNAILLIQDNGIGFDYKSLKNKSLGLTLIHDLSDQIEAKYTFENNNGTQFILNI